MIPGLTEALERRKRFVDETSETAEGEGIGGVLQAIGGTKSKFAGETFVERSPTGFTGLVNQGATCYLNSMLQMLYMTPDFRSALYAWRHDPEMHGEEQESLGLQLQQLFGKLQLSKRGACSTRALTRAFGWEGAEAFVQHDVLECMTTVLEHLETIGAGTRLGEWVHMGHKGELESFLQCTHCKSISESRQAFLAPPIPIKGCTSLDECLRAFCTPGDIEDYRCSSCDEKVTILKGQHFVADSLPVVLALQLNRFDFSFETLSRVKLNDAISYPEFLDMRPYCHRRLPDDEQPAASEPIWYELYAVMMHMGGAHGGHYFAYIKDLTMAEPRWIKFNDASVSDIDADKMRWAFGSESSGTSKKQVQSSGTSSSKKQVQSSGISSSTTEKQVQSSGASSSTTEKSEKQHDGPAPSPTAKAEEEAGKRGDHKDVTVVRSSTNAYMLAYRRHEGGPAHPGDRGRFAPPAIDAASLPSALREELEADNARYVELKREWDYLGELVRCKVYLPPDADMTDSGPLAGVNEQGRRVRGAAGGSSQTGSVVLHRSRSVDALTVAAARACGLVRHERDAAIEGEEAMPEENAAIDADKSNEGLWTAAEALERCRLRHFDSLRALMLAPIERPPRESEDGPPRRLEELAPPIEPHRPLVLEIREPGQPWTPWQEGGLPLKLVQAKRKSQADDAAATVGDHAMEAPKQVSVLGDSLADLRAAAARRLGIDVARTRLIVLHEETPVAIGEGIHPIAGGPSDDGSEWTMDHKPPPGVVREGPWNENLVRLDRDLKLVTGDSVFVETCATRYLPTSEDVSLSGPDALTARRNEPSSTLDMLENMVNQVEIRFNRPLYPNVLEQCMVDQRKPLSHLRQTVADTLGLAPDAFKILRTHKGPELKDGTKSLAYYGYMGGGRIWIVQGRPLQLGEFSIRLSLYDEEVAAKEDAIRPKQSSGAAAAGRPARPARPARPSRPSRPSRPPRGTTAKKSTTDQSSPPIHPGGGGGPPIHPGGGAARPRSLAPARPAASGSVAAAATGRFRPLGSIEVSEDTPVPEVKRLIAEAFGDQEGVPTPARMRLRERTGVKLAKVLVDTATLREAAGKRLTDDREIVIQTALEDETFAPGDMLLAVRRWHPTQGALAPAVEARFASDASVADLVAWIARRASAPDAPKSMRPLPSSAKPPETDSSAKSPESNSSANPPETNSSSKPPETESIGADHIRVGKAHGWQLHDQQEMASMSAWDRELDPGASLAGDPLRLQSGDTIVWKDARVAEVFKPDPTAEEAGGARRAGKSFAPREVAFKIYTPEERRQRAEERRKRGEKEIQDREAAKKAAEDGDGNNGPLVLDGHDMTKYLRLLAMGVEEERVVAGMMADGINQDNELLLRRALDIQAALQAKKETEEK